MALRQRQAPAKQKALKGFLVYLPIEDIGRLKTLAFRLWQGGETTSQAALIRRYVKAGLDRDGA